MLTFPVWYFQAKKMTKEHIAVFVAEHKWNYYRFGYLSFLFGRRLGQLTFDSRQYSALLLHALLEALPSVGSIFLVSNRVGAAMWTHDTLMTRHSLNYLVLTAI
ncbi:hypothetical protein EDB85DRAFT_1951403 [Lactarius pseudohatsudake]|nr:hypothetical protein EDB85DRAFT_1951403 [Lactarius pseudohatsudake]